jgi:hypothetical protein
MPINQPLIKSVLSGTIGGTQTWSVGLWVTTGIEVTKTQADLNSINNSIGGLFGTHTGDYVTPLFGSSTAVTGCTSYWWPPNATESALVSTPHAITGTGTGSSMPSLLAVVVSLRSSLPGRSGRGRNYLPLTKITAMDATGQISATVCSNLATAWALLIHQIGALHTPLGEPIIPVVTSFTTGGIEDITSVVVNSLADVQHRREDHIAMSTNAHADV